MPRSVVKVIMESGLYAFAHDAQAWFFNSERGHTACSEKYF
jgi:hypothetical protein